MSLYTINLKLNNQDCLVIGGGEIAERKIETLLDSGARVTVISPEVTDLVEQWAMEGKLHLIQREYHTGDLSGFILCIASTDVQSVNAAVYKEATDKNILINCVDIPDCCNFYVPSAIKRGDLQINFSTAGKAPFFSRRLREYFEKKLYNGMEDDLVKIYEMRDQIKKCAEGNIELKNKMIDQYLEPLIDNVFKKMDKQ